MQNPTTLNTLIRQFETLAQRDPSLSADRTTFGDDSSIQVRSSGMIAGTSDLFNRLASEAAFELRLHNEIMRPAKGVKVWLRHLFESRPSVRTFSSAGRCGEGIPGEYDTPFYGDQLDDVAGLSARVLASALKDWQPPATANDAAKKRGGKRRGTGQTPALTDDEVNKLATGWQKAKDAGTLKKDYAGEQNLSITEFDNLVMKRFKRLEGRDN